MFTLCGEWGDHKIYQYDTNSFSFLEYFQDLFQTKQLDQLHLHSADYYNKVNLDERDTDLHQIFYKNIKSDDTTFKQLYCRFVQSIFKTLFSNETVYIYQSFPSIRIQYPDSKTVPPHKDSDSLSNHPLGEINFIIPITSMLETNTIYIESTPDKKDFKAVHLNYGDLFHFNGNTCTHYNVPNKENKLRISLDFRIILVKDYNKYIMGNQIISTNPRDIYWKREPKPMRIGGYYQISTPNESIEQMLEWKHNQRIPQHRPSFGKEEADACYQYMLDDTFVTEYTKTTELEELICRYVGCNHCIMTTSGTQALILALMSLELQQGDSVIVPNYTMIATINAVKMLNLNPVIVDVNPDTFTLSAEIIQKYINEVKCVIHVSLNNRYQNLQQIVELCHEHNIVLIEDSAQSLGCKVDGKSLGTFGKIGCFSLSSPKIISTGQGGFLVTDDLKLAKKIRMIKNFGRKESGFDDFEIFGINSKFTDIQAVIGIEQMKKMDDRVQKMRHIYDLYLENLPELMIPALNHEWIPWFVDIFIDNRQVIIDYLQKHQIQTRPVYKAINQTKLYNCKASLVNSETITNRGLFLPSYLNLTDSDIRFICKVLRCAMVLTN